MKEYFRSAHAVPLANIDPFQRAFDVKAGDKMYRAPEERVKIW